MVSSAKSPFAEDLARSGLTSEQADAAGIYEVDDAREVYPDFKPLPAMVIPYYRPDGDDLMTFDRDGEETEFARVRYLKAPPQTHSFIKKKPQRYAQPLHSPVFAYFPRTDEFQWPDVLQDVEKPLCIVEGEKKALAVCLAGVPCVGLGGVYNFMRDGDLLPELATITWKERDVYICFDSDAANNRDIQLAERRLCAELTRRGASVYIVRLPDFDDAEKVGADDYIVRKGVDAFIGLLEETHQVDPGKALVVEGTDVEIAQAVLRDLEDAHNSAVVSCEGDFYVYDGRRWKPLPPHVIEKAVYRYDKARCGKRAMVKITDGKSKSVNAIMTNLAYEPDFFAEAPDGINCATGFIQFDPEGEPYLEPHKREHRQRHCLPGAWRPGDTWQGGGLLGRFLEGCFGEDSDLADKVDLVGEICGVAALGVATKLIEPRAIVAFGDSAANGKSELLKMVTGLLPRDAVCSVPPTKFNENPMLFKLIGCRLNACAELGTAQAISADVFKSAVTGDQITVRDVYRSAVSFRPSTLHLFATNTLPTFRGGFDRGVQRRLLVLRFKRSIPERERVLDIGLHIALEEADALLAFAVDGARRVIQNGRFTEPVSSRTELHHWVFSADPVLAWWSSRAEYAPESKVSTKKAYSDFKFWAEENGFSKNHLPAVNNFAGRLFAQDGRLSNSRNSHDRFIIGLKLLPTGKLSSQVSE